MYPVLDRVLGPFFTLEDWLDRFVPRGVRTAGNPLPLLAHAFTDVSNLVPQLVDLAKNGQLPWYPVVDTVAPYFGYLCQPADPETNIAVCIDGHMVRNVGLSTLLWDMFDEAKPWFMLTILILGFLMVTRALLFTIDRVFKFVTGTGHLEAVILKYRAVNAELEEAHTEQVTTLMELTISLGPIEGKLLQNDIKVARLKQANVDSSVKLRAAQDELDGAKRQAQTLRADLKDTQDLYAQASACLRETEDRLADDAAQAADVERNLLHELADHDAQLDALDMDHAALLAAEDSLKRELAEHTQAHQQAAASLASEALAAHATLTTLQNEISAEAAAHEAAAIERQKGLAQLVFQIAALTAREFLDEQEHAATLAAAQAEEASLEAQLASVNEELVAARTDHASLVDERDSLLHETSAVKANIDKAIEDGAIAEAALLMAATDIRAVDHEHTAALEKDVADLTDSLTHSTAAYNDVQERLDLSVFEHRQHMHTCAAERAEEAEQLAFLETWAAQEEAALDALNAEAAALTASAPDALTEFEEERQGLEWRLKMTSGGWAKDQAQLDAARAELKAVLDAHDTERRQHRAAVAGYQAGARADDALADDLLTRLTEAQARVALLEAQAEEDASLEEAQLALDRVRADAQVVALETSARDADIMSVSAEIIKARRALGAQEAETARLQDAYERRLAWFGEENRALEQRIGFEGTLHRAERDEVKDRIKLLEAALRICGPGDGDKG
ncbi:hypothetical protein PsYK624_142580 [Phanerochaete sordida]|uniref:Uncharacterized protein n=1 Tax=Phanerochaete sordida TaxID=48140 RepID=A0A9P3LK04_9APHY|nr:hypothetical protein PsYK624_142580 [Phanerochaete sordida]